MEDLTHCMIHRTKTAEYVCPACHNLPLCEACKLEHVSDTKHVPENYKEVGVKLMHQHIKYADGKQARGLVKELRDTFKELEAGFLREIGKFQSSCMQTEEQCLKMQKLDSEGKYAELYFYAKSLPTWEVAMEELNKRVQRMFNAASDGFKKTCDKIAAEKGVTPQYKPVFSAYEKGEVFMLVGKSYEDEAKVISALKSEDMPKFKAAYIYSGNPAGDRVFSELASRLQACPISAFFLVNGEISDAGAGVLAKAVFCNKSLSAFCFGSDKISDIGAKAVAEAARNCRSLTTFSFCSNGMSDSGAKVVAEAVKYCPLSAFCIGGKEISDEGAIAVAETAKNRPLSAFYLWSTVISDAGAIAVAKSVKDCPLSVFHLRCNKISDAGATAVAEIISSGCTSTLSAFCLSSDSISDSCAKKVANAVRNCPLLSTFYLCSNPLPGEALAYILENMAGISTIRSVGLRIGDVSKEQMDSCLDRLQQSGVARQLKLRFQCDTD